MNTGSEITLDIMDFGTCDIHARPSTREKLHYDLAIYIVIMTLAFLYQLNKGLSPFLVLVSAISALPAIKSSCR